MQLLAISLTSYITPTTVKAALFLITFVFVCAGLGRRSLCGLIPLAVTGFIAAGLAIVRLTAPGYAFALEDVLLLAGYAVIGISSLLTLRLRGFGVVTGATLLVVESYQAITHGAVLIAAAMKGFHEAGGALSEQEIDLWSLAWCLFSMLFMVIYCCVIGFSRSFLKKDRALVESELLLQASPLPMELTLEEILPAEEEILPEEEIIPDEPIPPRTPVAPRPVSEPTKPTQPTPPVQPTRPIQPTKPVQPTKPTQPTPPAQPAEPVQPTRPIQPTKPVQPTRPVQPTKPVPPAAPREDEATGIGAEILRYKHLLDEGLITEEVFRERKEELMNGTKREDS